MQILGCGQSILSGAKGRVNKVFKVVNRVTGHILAVYAVSGNLFLVWNNSTEDAHWEWISMDRCAPVISEKEI